VATPHVPVLVSAACTTMPSNVDSPTPQPSYELTRSDEPPTSNIKLSWLVTVPTSKETLVSLEVAGVAHPLLVPPDMEMIFQLTGNTRNKMGQLIIENIKPHETKNEVQDE